jgi:hypothetical protein
MPDRAKQSIAKARIVLKQSRMVKNAKAQSLSTAAPKRRPQNLPGQKNTNGHTTNGNNTGSSRKRTRQGKKSQSPDLEDPDRDHRLAILEADAIEATRQIGVV